jgi:hypothetical protein
MKLSYSGMGKYLISTPGNTFLSIERTALSYTKAMATKKTPQRPPLLVGEKKWSLTTLKPIPEIGRIRSGASVLDSLL